MSINTVFDLGLEIFDDYMVAKRRLDFQYLAPMIHYIDHAKLLKFYKAYYFYKAFEESNHSYITAYKTANYDSTHQSVLFNAIENSSRSLAGENLTRRDRFIQLFSRSLSKNLLHVQVDYEVRLENPPSYGFLMEVITCKEVRQLALVLLFAGMMSIVLGASSALGIAAATTALAAVGVTATTAIVGGGITAAVGLGLRLFKPQASIDQWAALQAHTMAEIKKNTLELPPQSMSMGSRD